MSSDWLRFLNSGVVRKALYLAIAVGLVVVQDWQDWANIAWDYRRF